MLPRPFESGVEALLPNPVYLFALLMLLSIAAARFGFRWRWRSAVLICAVWAYLGTTPAITRMLLPLLEDRYAPVDLATVERGADILLLASGSVERHRGRATTRLDAPAWERTAAAAELWKRTGGRLIVLGGPTMDRLSPSRAMAEIAVSLGVPAELVSYDDRQLTTRAGFQFAAPPMAGAAAPWLVTSAIHMPRAMLAAEHAGWRLRPYPCDYIATDSPGWQQWSPSTAAYRQNIEMLHEYVGLVYYKLRKSIKQ